MTFRTIFALGAGIGMSYSLYRFLTNRSEEPSPQWADEPEGFIEQDRVDEAAWESFPASDPPSFNVSRST